MKRFLYFRDTKLFHEKKRDILAALFFYEKNRSSKSANVSPDGRQQMIAQRCTLRRLTHTNVMIQHSAGPVHLIVRMSTSSFACPLLDARLSEPSRPSDLSNKRKLPIFSAFFIHRGIYSIDGVERGLSNLVLIPRADRVHSRKNVSILF